MRQSLYAHPVIAASTAVYTAGWAAYGLAVDSPLAVPYLIQMVVLAWLVVRLDQRRPFTTVVLAGLSLWGFLHMIGGMVTIGDATLYETWLLPVLRWDHVVHAVGFGFGGMAVFETFLPWMSLPVTPRAAAWVAFMGSAAIGAINETVEFVASRVLDFANIGDEVNTGLDLVANMFGGFVAAWFVHRRVSRRSTQ
jgi:putative membrane protein